MSTTRAAPRKPPTDFVDALALQAVETFVERIRERLRDRPVPAAFLFALDAELLDWQTAIPDEVRHGWRDEP